MKLASTRLVVSLALALTACGGAAEEMPDAVPHWEDKDASPYNFYRGVSYTLLKTGQYVRASRTVRRLLKLKPDEAEPFYLMGRAYIGMGQLDAAKRMFVRSIDNDDEFAPAQSMMGVLLNMLGDHKRAGKFHRRAIQLDFDKADYRNNLGFGLYLQGRYKQSIGAYRAALERDAGATRVHNNLAFAYAKLGRMQKAYSHFKLAGPPAQASNNMGYVYEKAGKLESAYEYYVLAVRQDTRLIPARNNLTALSERLGRPMPEIELESQAQPEPIGEEPASFEAANAPVAPAIVPAATEGTPP